MELTPFLHSVLPADPVAAHVSFSVNSDASFAQAKWAAKQHTVDNVLPFDGLSQASSPEFNRTYPQKLILNSLHSASPFAQHDYLRLGCDVFRLGCDFHALRPRKLRKLLTTFSEGVHIFSCVEKVNTPICADLEWSSDAFAHIHPYLGKKRPWQQFCSLGYAGLESIDANTGFLNGRILPQTPFGTCNQGSVCVKALGAGGSSDGSGYGEGGGGHGDDGGGSQQPDFDGQEVPIEMNWHAFAEDSDEDRVTHIKPGTADKDLSEGLSENGWGTMLRNVLGVLDDPQNDNHKEACSIRHAAREVLNRILENLDGVLSQSHPDLKQVLHNGEGDLNFKGQYSTVQTLNDAAFAYDSCDLQNDLQGIDSAFASQHSAAGDDGIFNNLLEKLRGLNLDFADGALDTQIDSMQAETFRTLNFKEAVGVNTGNAMDLQPLANQTSSSLSTEETRQSLGGQLQGVVDWLDRFAHNLSGKQTSKHERPDYQVEDQKLKTMVNEAVATALLKHLSDVNGAPPAAKQADTEALKRLQREVFSELLILKDKVDQIASAKQRDNANRFSGGKTNLQGEVKVGVAFVVLEDSSSRHSRGSLEQAGMQTGVDVKLTFETPFRDKDSLITEFIAGQSSSVGEDRGLGGPMSLGKVQYLAHVNDGVAISIVPTGARGMDLMDIVNPLQDQGLTSFSSRGPALFDHCKGSAVGATWSGSSFALSAAHYLSGWGNQMLSLGADARESGPLCLSTLGQLLLQPTERLIFSLSGLNRFWPSPPLPSSMGLHWSEMGPLVIPKIHSLQTSGSIMSSEESFASHFNSGSSPWGMLESEYNLDESRSKGTSQLSVAAAAEVEISENLSIGAWAQVDDALQELDKGNFQWALNLAKASKNGVAWGASVGGSRPDVWSILSSEQDMYPGFGGDVKDSQLHLEAFVRINCGKGFTLQPGLLYLLNKHSRTPAFMVRSSWLF